MTLCDKGEGGQNWSKKALAYVIVERPLINFFNVIMYLTSPDSIHGQYR